MGDELYALSSTILNGMGATANLGYGLAAESSSHDQPEYVAVGETLKPRRCLTGSALRSSR